jgi:hypothetical protein
VLSCGFRRFAAVDVRESALAPEAEAVEIQIDDRRRVKREHLADDQAADDRDAERPPQFRAVAEADASGMAPSSAAMSSS